MIYRFTDYYGHEPLDHHYPFDDEPIQKCPFCYTGPTDEQTTDELIEKLIGEETCKEIRDRIDSERGIIE